MISPFNFMSTKSAMSPAVWALGMYFGIAGLVMSNSPLALFLSGSLLMWILLWTGQTLVSVTNVTMQVAKPKRNARGHFIK